MGIDAFIIKFGAAGSPQPITIAEQVFAAMPVGFGSVTQDRWRSNSVVVNGIAFTVFPGLDSDGRADCWIYAAYGEATSPNTFSGINREVAAVDLQITLNGVAQNLFGAGTTYSYNHQRSTWLRWQSNAMAWDTSSTFINARISDGTFLRHDSRNVFGSLEQTNPFPATSGYQPFKTFCDIDQTQYIGDQLRACTSGGERSAIGPVHEWFARLITEVGTNGNAAWITAPRLQMLRDLAETAAQFPHASGLVDPITNRLLDPSVKPHCTNDNPNAWFAATGIPQPGMGTGPSSVNGNYDNSHPFNKFSFHAYALSRDPWHLFQTQAQAVCALAYQSLFNGSRGTDGKTLMISQDQERGLWWGLQMLVQAWSATPSGAMPKPFRDKAWFKTAIDNTLQFIRDKLISSTTHLQPGIVGEAMRYWRGAAPIQFSDGTGEYQGSHFQEDYGHIVLAQSLMLGYSGARDVAEWHVANIQRRLDLGGSWFLNDYEKETAATSPYSGYSICPATGPLPYSDAASFKAWYPRKTTYTSGPVTAEFWRQQYGRDTYLFLGAVNITKEAARRGLLTPGFDLLAAETNLRSRFVAPYTNAAGNPLNYNIASKQYFNYQGGAVPTPVDTYTVASGKTMYFGTTAPVSGDAFDSLSYTDTGAAMITATYDTSPLIIEFPGSNKSTSAVTSNGRNYVATVSGKLALTGQTSFQFDTFISQYADNAYYPSVHPRDHWTNDAGQIREAQGLGFLLADGYVYLTQEHRANALMAWVNSTFNAQQLVQAISYGGSMGAWASISYGVRRYSMFAAVYADRPRWRRGYPTYGQYDASTTISVPTWANDWTDYPIASSPQIAAQDGGGTLYDYRDMVTYVSNTANKVRPILWCIGKQDGYACWQDQLDAVAALRAAGRMFVFAWNNGNHSTGSIMNQIMQSYPPGTYRKDKGYPLFTEHSLDNDPAVDLVGGINIGLKFRNVVETAAGWSCEVTSIRGACTVKVKPISDVFKANVSATLVSIPAASTWVPVSFTA